MQKAAQALRKSSPASPREWPGEGCDLCSSYVLPSQGLGRLHWKEKAILVLHSPLNRWARAVVSSVFI